MRDSQPQVVWFKRDLRVTDHRPLFEASRVGPVIPLFVDEPDLWLLPDVSTRHRVFIADALESLERDLGVCGLTLCIMHGSIESALDAIRAAFGAFTLWSHEETGNAWTFARDRRVATWCRDRGVIWHEFAQHGVVRGLRSRNGWAGVWERRMAEPLLGAPEPLFGSLRLAERAGFHIAERRPVQQLGSRAQAETLLESFLNHRGKRYQRELSSPLSAERSCSRISAHLAYGVLSLREVVQAGRRRIAALDPADPATTTWRRSLQAFIARLHWHCHFIQKLETQPSIEFRNIHRAYDGLRENAFNETHFAAWKCGETGIPFVDACMRSLIHTGWINFRMRAMLCAFSSYHLWLHWQRPAHFLAGLFTDYEPGIHISQMQMQSGTTGINTLRIYNPVKQGLDHDAQGRFIRHWCPELAALPDAMLHEPWKSDAAGLARFGVKLGGNYPDAVVDHVEAARKARDKAWAVRDTAQFHAAANAIQQKHGSRMSGLPQIRKKRASNTRPTEQDDRRLLLPFDDMPTAEDKRDHA